MRVFLTHRLAHELAAHVFIHRTCFDVYLFILYHLHFPQPLPLLPAIRIIAFSAWPP